MKFQLVYSIFVLATGFRIIASQECESGWLPFKDEKCFKLFEQLVTFEEAESICFMQSASDDISPLATIQSAEEQALVSDLVFVQLGIVDNVWLGAAGVNGTNFFWLDGTQMDFTNWQEGFPSGIVDHNCVQMVPSGEKRDSLNGQIDETQGTWTDTSCQRHNYVLCQRMQAWSGRKLQKFVMERTKEFEKANEKLKNELEQLHKNPVPIGFIYVQLPNQDEAKVTWPEVEWEDVTAMYAGLFFRAEGGGSEVFGVIQEDSTRQISAIQYDSIYEAGYSGFLTVPPVAWSGYVVSGARTSTTQDYWEGLRFHTLETEVRPRNMAIRIWRRTA